MPKVSIILPTYNGSRYIKKSIDSILSQTFKDFELIIIDDCSSDNTSEIIENYLKIDPRIKFIKHLTNEKLPSALNSGFKIANGEYFSWTSDDNIYKDNAIEILVNYLDNNKEIGLVYSDMAIIDENGNIIQNITQPEPDNLIIQNCVGACFMYRSEVARNIGLYDPNMFLVEDYDYWLRIGLNYKLAHIHQELYLYRFHDNSLRTSKHFLILSQLRKLMKKYAKLYQVSRGQKIKIYNSLKHLHSNKIFYKLLYRLLEQITYLRK